MRISTPLFGLLTASMAFVVCTVVAQDHIAHDDSILALEHSFTATKGTQGFPDGLDSAPFELVDQRIPAAQNKAHWSAQASDGLEFKIHNKTQTSAVWVLKRSDRYDLIFASSAGSRVNLTIPAEQFYALKNTATDLRAPASDTSKCKDNYVQLEVMDQKTRKTLATCLSARSAPAEKLKEFGAALTAYVR